jgi:outer membrane protein, heavy metal efflux system
MQIAARGGALLLAALLLAGCASVPRDAGFSDVRQQAADRADLDARWLRSAGEDREAAEAVRALLADSLTAEAAVQVALLNNRRLQATYEGLGIAQADLVQAGLLRNPVFGAHPRWPLDGGPPDLAFSVAFDFLGVLSLPMRQRVAASTYESARLRVTEAVLAHAADTRAAFVRALAAEQEVELMEQVVFATELAFDAAERLRAAGNIRRLDLLHEQALYETARLDLEAAQGRRLETRERLARSMGVWGRDAAFTLAGRLPDPPSDRDEFGEGGEEGVEARAVEASLALAAARADVETAARRLGLTDVEAAVPSFGLGAEIEREGDHWKAGPDLHLALPLLDAGQARRAGGRAALRQEQAAYLALAVEVRSAARAARARVLAARRQALHLRRVVLPLRAELTAETQLQYNAMQVGVFHLLAARQQEVDAGRRYLDALAAYWEARADLDLILQGGTPEGTAPGGSGSPHRPAAPTLTRPGH